LPVELGMCDPGRIGAWRATAAAATTTAHSRRAGSSPLPSVFLSWLITLCRGWLPSFWRAESRSKHNKGEPPTGRGVGSRRERRRTTSDRHFGTIGVTGCKTWLSTGASVLGVSGRHDRLAFLRWRPWGRPWCSPLAERGFDDIILNNALFRTNRDYLSHAVVLCISPHHDTIPPG